MTQVEFNYNGAIITINCESNEKMKDIYKKFTKKTSVDINSVYFL